MTNDQALTEYLLRLADTDMVLAQRFCEWCGNAPALEEEIAMMNVGLDLIGQARNWYDYVAELRDDGHDADFLAFRRNEREYRNLLIAEQPRGDYAVTTAKQFFFDVWHHLVLTCLTESNDERIAGIAAKGLKEVTYHRRRSTEWMLRLGQGTDESHRRLTDVVQTLWRFTYELTDTDQIEDQLAEAGIGAGNVGDAWRNEVARVFAEAGLALPEPARHFYMDGKNGKHTEHLGFLLAEMQYLPRAYPDATW
ncbi:1,2-phenylacetyl-CoA epoxidase subunit PaaC [Alloalcanivorax marinus]|uniref:1,2-phenylacetyl-CoA epoxidase subunit PaaC n=1 Tax=Alloalcanivorax marinus TaxID=1177169 RepID=UPI001933BCF0|nr:1,2-phenylacetyl-CoA epoxidase subunit PaaC [Alloalcanivorax marinus]MBL7250553.1 phenylacetate-CoA oxygenase subunit PaaC [Alloalcanivorax marinus]